MALTPVFTLKLNHKILPRLVTVGKYDGEHPCLTAATNGQKVFIHNPHGGRIGRIGDSRLSSSSSENDISLLTMGNYIMSLGAGKLYPGSTKDTLLVGMHTSFLAYDVDNNSDVFYKEMPDGASSIVVGSHIPAEPALTYVGGNCSITALDADGEDKFWTVTGDNVCALALCDFDCDGHEELIVGSEDYDIRIFRGDELIHEMTEADAVTSLCALDKNRFGFALMNGIVGVYAGEQRLWRSKSKHTALCIAAYDYTADGVLELVTGWSSGKVDIRNVETGEVIAKDNFSSHVAGIVVADYRMDGKEELICCSVDGEVRGYLPPVPADPSVSVSQPGLDPSLLVQLSQRKTSLELELKNFKVSEQIVKSRNPLTAADRHADPRSVISMATQIQSAITAEPKSSTKPAHLQLTIETSTVNTILKMAVVFADGLFEGESLIVHPNTPKSSNRISSSIFPEKDIPVDLQIKVFAGQPGTTHFHVFDVNKSLPRFCMYVPCCLDKDPQPHGSVTFTINERVERVCKWVEANFLYAPAGRDAMESSHMQVAYLSLRTTTPLIIRAGAGRMTILTDDMDLAGDIIQALMEDFNIEDLSSVAKFPKHMEDLKEILTRLEEFHKVRETLTAEMADHSSMIRNLVVRAEDSRLMDDMSSMKRAYMQLHDLNKEIIRGYEIRRSNHLELLECLRIVNQAVQKASRLRGGKAKTLCTNSCRAAIKQSDQDALIRAIELGTA